MADILLKRDSALAGTYIPNTFIDEYMTHADGEFVKIYLYLLRCMGNPDTMFSISDIADKFDHTEKDVTRALRYWEKMHLLRLEFNKNKELASICLSDIALRKAAPASHAHATGHAQDLHAADMPGHAQDLHATDVPDHAQDLHAADVPGHAQDLHAADMPNYVQNPHATTMPSHTQAPHATGRSNHAQAPHAANMSGQAQNLHATGRSGHAQALYTTDMPGHAQALHTTGLPGHAQALHTTGTANDANQPQAAGSAWNVSAGIMQDAATGSARNASVSSSQDAATGSAWDASTGNSQDAAMGSAWNASVSSSQDAVMGSAWNASAGSSQDAAMGSAWNASTDSSQDAATGSAWDASAGSSQDAATGSARNASTGSSQDAAAGTAQNASVGSVQDTPAGSPQDASAGTADAHAATHICQLPKRTEYSRNQLKQFQEDEAVAELLFVAERYLGHPLNHTETQMILYWLDKLEFSQDMIEYLIEQCVAKNHRSVRYMDKIALAWAEAGIRTLTDARQASDVHSNAARAVQKAFGILNRALVGPELKYVQKWSKEMGFSDELIALACEKTIQRIHQINFEYTQTILQSWKQQNARTLNDIKLLDAQYQETKAKQFSVGKTAARTAKGTTAGGFANFSQRSYNYDELERELLSYAR